LEWREIRKKNKNKVSPLERDTQEKQGLTAGHCPPPTHTHQALLDYRVIKSNTKLAGISGGAVASTLLAAEVNPTTAVQSFVARLLGVRRAAAAEAPAYAAAADAPRVDPAAGVLGPDFGKLAGGMRFVLNSVRCDARGWGGGSPSLPPFQTPIPPSQTQ